MPAPVVLNQKKIFWISGINPQPWSVGSFSRKVKRVVKSGSLDIYQKAIKEEMAGQWPYGPFDASQHTPIALQFAFWRQLENERDADGRWHRGKIADATNLQKALEDALQGVLFTNDRYVADIRSRIVAQGPYVEPKIGICVRPATNCQLQLEMEIPPREQ